MGSGKSATFVEWGRGPVGCGGGRSGECALGGCELGGCDETVRGGCAALGFGGCEFGGRCAIICGALGRGGGAFGFGIGFGG